MLSKKSKSKVGARKFVVLNTTVLATWGLRPNLLPTVWVVCYHLRSHMYECFPFFLSHQANFPSSPAKFSHSAAVRILLTLDSRLSKVWIGASPERLKGRGEAPCGQTCGAAMADDDWVPRAKSALEAGMSNEVSRRAQRRRTRKRTQDPRHSSRTRTHTEDTHTHTHTHTQPLIHMN